MDYTKDTLTMGDVRVCEDKCPAQGSGHERVHLEHREQYPNGVQNPKGIDHDRSHLIIPSHSREPNNVSVDSSVHKEYEMEFSMLEESAYQSVEESGAEAIRSSVYEDKNDGARVMLERSSNRHSSFHCDEETSARPGDDFRKSLLFNSVSCDLKHSSNVTLKKESRKSKSDGNFGLVVSDFLPKTPEAQKCVERDLQFSESAEDNSFNCQETLQPKSYGSIENINKHSDFEEMNFPRAENSLKGLETGDMIYKENSYSSAQEESYCHKADLVDVSEKESRKITFENSSNETGGRNKSFWSRNNSFSERIGIGKAAAAAALTSLHADVVTANERVMIKAPRFGHVESGLIKDSLAESEIFVEPGLEESSNGEMNAHAGLHNELIKRKEYPHFDEEDNAKPIKELSKRSLNSDKQSQMMNTDTISDFHSEYMTNVDQTKSFCSTSKVNEKVDDDNNNAENEDKMEETAESSSDQSDTDEKNSLVDEDTTLMHSADSPQSPPVGARRRFKCKICDKSWKLRKDLKNHLKTHKEINKFTCSVCNSSFINRTLLKKHLLTHSDANLFTCSDCPTTCSSLLDLKHHKRTHAGAQTFSCTECSYVAKHQKGLTKHMLVHSTSRDYNCQFCKFSSKRKYSLQRHLKTAHSSVEVHECSVCNLKLSTVESAKAHVAMHLYTKTKPCIICGAVIRKEKKFIKHFLNHSNDEDITCEECDETYTTGSEYILHLLSHRDIASNSQEEVSQASVLDSSTVALLNGRVDSTLDTLGFLTLKNRIIMDTPTMEKKLSQMSNLASRLVDMSKVVSLLNEKSKVVCQLAEISTLATELAVISSNVLQAYKNTYGVGLAGGTSTTKTKAPAPLMANDVSEDSSDPDDDYEMPTELNMPAANIKEELHDSSYPSTEAGMQIQVDLNGEAVSCVQSESKSKGGKYLKCTRCNLTCTDSRSLKRHLLVHDDVRPYSCEKCGQSFRRNEHLKKHMVTHTDERPFVCKECSYAAKTEHRLKLHALCHSQTRSFACQHCTYTGRTNYELNHHMKRHEPRSCSQCNFICYSRGEMKKHVFTHSSFGCNECEYTTSDKAEYNKHMKRHSLVQHLCCELCGYSCDTMKKFKYHKLRHENKTPYQCSDCDYKCSSRASFDCHRLKHAGLKPYLCSFCGAAFRKTSHLNQHLLIHKDEKAFKCNECGYSCRTKHNLKEHEMTHSGEKPFACKYCSFSCRRNKALQLHMLKHENPSLVIPQLQMPSLQFSHLQMPLQMPMIPSGP